uniref:Secreted protein n=1 Tax=Romanomermis culicivorax TaxID=13658 RepID=A0A915KRX1_ROMCU
MINKARFILLLAEHAQSWARRCSASTAPSKLFAEHARQADICSASNTCYKYGHVSDWANLSKIEQCAHDQCEILRALIGRYKTFCLCYACKLKNDD